MTVRFPSGICKENGIYDGGDLKQWEKETLSLLHIHWVVLTESGQMVFCWVI